MFSKLLIGLLAFAASVSCTSASEVTDTDQCDRKFGVRIGNVGKDVIWVPTHTQLVEAMLEAAETTDSDYVIDLGSGDGRVPVAAAKLFGARALGVELDPRMVELARCYAQAARVEHLVEIRQADIFETDFSAATVLTLYLLPRLNLKLRPAILRMKPGTRVISNRFTMGEWRPDRVITVEGVANQALLWIVPAEVSGLWRFEQQQGDDAFQARFEQSYQKIEGTVLGRSSGRLHSEKLSGATIEFTLVRRGRALQLKGTVEGDKMTLSATHDAETVAYVGEKY